MPETVDINYFYAVMIGVGLAAATGFRIFIPFLVAGIAGNLGVYEVPDGFTWVTSWPAIAAFGVASLVEVGAYYVPWVDNALDSVATPAAFVAGTVMTAGFLPDMAPWLEWGLGAIIGGGAASTIQLGSVMTRLLSSGTTGGLGNAGVSTAEAGGAVTASLVTVYVPILGFLLVLAMIAAAIKFLLTRGKRRRARQAAEATTLGPEPAKLQRDPIDPDAKGR